MKRSYASVDDVIFRVDIVAVCCSVLQCVAVWKLRHYTSVDDVIFRVDIVAVCCSALRCDAVCCSVQTVTICVSG